MQCNATAAFQLIVSRLDFFPSLHQLILCSIDASMACHLYTGHLSILLHCKIDVEVATFIVAVALLGSGSAGVLLATKLGVVSTLYYVRNYFDCNPYLQSYALSY